MRIGLTRYKKGVPIANRFARIALATKNNNKNNAHWCALRHSSESLFLDQDDGKGGLSLRGVAFMTVLTVLAVLKSTLPSFCLPYKIECQETVLAVSVVVAVRS